MTKTELAQALKVSPATVSGWIRRGLPVLLDGNLDPGAALRWLVGQRYRGARRETKEIIDRATTLLRETASAPIPDWQRAVERMLCHLAAPEMLSEFRSALVSAGVPKKHSETAASCLAGFLEVSYQTNDGRQWFQPQVIAK